MKTRIILVSILLLFACSMAWSDYIEISRHVTIKQDHQGDAALFGTAEEGERFPIIDGMSKTNGYYPVHFDNTGRVGWVSHFFARAFTGEIPVTEETPVVTTEPFTGLSNLTPQQQAFAARHLKPGLPQSVFVRVREGYVVGVDARLKVPLWAEYELSPGDLDGPAERGNRDFDEDATIPFDDRVNDDDYIWNRELDRYAKGHLVPAEDMTRSDKVMDETFLYSNCAPQIGSGFNGSAWKSLENAVRGWVQTRGSLTVITGAVFAADNGKVAHDVVGPHNVGVATHFYKIVVDLNDANNPQALAFLMPHRRVVGESYKTFTASIDSIEKLTGLDFLSALPLDVQNRIESQRPTTVW